LRTSIEPKAKLEISTSSAHQSVSRKPESLSALTSPKSVIKGTPKVVMVPVDDEEPSCVYPMTKQRFLDSHQELDESDAQDIPEMVFFYPLNLRPRTPVQSFGEEKA
jgi:hypothetical protein